jgi:cell division protein FtsN
VSSKTRRTNSTPSIAALQRRYGPILEGLDANIQRADLGDRGIYYRVRVGPWAERGQALQVCEALQAAGGDCYVTQ